jgi:TatA/E family protein of Tat protein translocase
MLGIGMQELILILIVALLVIGPKKLPELAKALGRALGEFRRATDEIKENLEIESTYQEKKDNISSNSFQAYPQEPVNETQDDQKSEDQTKK